jgi:hypothetical protein
MYNTYNFWVNSLLAFVLRVQARFWDSTDADAFDPDEVIDGKVRNAMWLDWVGFLITC